jgi:MFS family permease
MKRNIALLFGVDSAKWALMSMPIFVVYLLGKGFSLSEIFLLQSIYGGSIFLFEIPSGRLADIGNRKQILISALLLRAIGKLAYSDGSTFLDFAIAEVFVALSVALISGTDVSMLYDSLAERGKQLQFKRVESKRIATSQFSAAISGLLGGALASVSLELPFVAEGCVCLTMAALMYLAKEPARYIKEERTTKKAKLNLIGIIRFSLNTHKSLRWLILLTSSMLASVSAMVFLAQPYMELAGLPIELFGFVWCFCYLMAAVTSALTPALEQRFGTATTLKGMSLLPGAVLILFSFHISLWLIGLIATFFAVRAMMYSISRTYVNEIVESDIRATVLSVKGSVSRLCFAILGPIIGYMCDAMSLQAGLFISGSLFLLSMTVLCSLLLRSEQAQVKIDEQQLPMNALASAACVFGKTPR